MCILFSSTRMQLNGMFHARGVGYAGLEGFERMAGRKLRPCEIFLLKRLVRNLKGSQVGPSSDINCVHHMSSIRWSNCLRQWTKRTQLPNQEITATSRWILSP